MIHAGKLDTTNNIWCTSQSMWIPAAPPVDTVDSDKYHNRAKWLSHDVSRGMCDSDINVIKMPLRVRIRRRFSQWNECEGGDSDSQFRSQTYPGDSYWLVHNYRCVTVISDVALMYIKTCKSFWNLHFPKIVFLVKFTMRKFHVLHITLY